MTGIEWPHLLADLTAKRDALNAVIAILTTQFAGEMAAPSTSRRMGGGQKPRQAAAPQERRESRTADHGDRERVAAQESAAAARARGRAQDSAACPGASVEAAPENRDGRRNGRYGQSAIQSAGIGVRGV